MSTIYKLETLEFQEEDTGQQIETHFKTMTQSMFKNMTWGLFRKIAETARQQYLSPEDRTILAELEARCYQTLSFSSLQRMLPIKGFNHLKRYRFQDERSRPVRSPVTPRNDSYAGFMLLINHHYPHPNKSTFLIIAEDISVALFDAAANNRERICGRNLIQEWLSGRFSNRTAREQQHRLDYLLVIGYWLRINFPLTISHKTEIAQWENLLCLESLTPTQKEVRPLPDDTDDHGAWLVFADALEEVNPDDRDLQLIRFFHTVNS